MLALGLLLFREKTVKEHKFTVVIRQKSRKLQTCLKLSFLH